jgi:hypothetical protein
MFQELLALLPKDAPPHAVPIGIAVAIAGVMLWLIAAKYSRYFIALLTVALGAVIGMHLPQWFGWSVPGAGTAVGAAVVLGVTGFVLHGLWIGLGLGICCSLWVTLVLWMIMRNGQTWIWPAITPETTTVSYARECWSLLPPSMAHILPIGAAASVITALAMAIIWPRLTTALKWSLTGLTMALFGALVACNYWRPELLAQLPTATPVQVAILAGLLGIGAGIQWKIAPRVAGAAGKKKRSAAAPPENAPPDLSVTSRA